MKNERYYFDSQTTSSTVISATLSLVVRVVQEREEVLTVRLQLDVPLRLLHLHLNSLAGHRGYLHVDAVVMMSFPLVLAALFFLLLIPLRVLPRALLRALALVLLLLVLLPLSAALGSGNANRRRSDANRRLRRPPPRLLLERFGPEAQN